MTHKLTIITGDTIQIHYFDSLIKCLVFATHHVLSNPADAIHIKPTEAPK